MADTMRLTDGTTTIDFSPMEGYVKPDDFSVNRHSSVSGKEYSYKYFKKRRWEIPLDYMLSADVETISGWWSGLAQLTLYDDYINSPATFYSVRIYNTNDPLSSFHFGTWKDKYTGTLILREL